MNSELIAAHSFIKVKTDIVSIGKCYLPPAVLWFSSVCQLQHIHCRLISTLLAALTDLSAVSLQLGLMLNLSFKTQLCFGHTQGMVVWCCSWLGDCAWCMWSSTGGLLCKTVLCMFLLVFLAVVMLFFYVCTPMETKWWSIWCQFCLDTSPDFHS